MRVSRACVTKRPGEKTCGHITGGYHGHAVLEKFCCVLAERKDMHLLLVRAIKRKLAETIRAEMITVTDPLFWN